MSSGTERQKTYHKHTFGRIDVLRVCMLARPKIDNDALKDVIRAVFDADISDNTLAVMKCRIKKKGMAK
jgi:hypothetical protein